ncbi:MAG: hypothetical protein A3I11_04235 [Elusimicrobia bacterium RIFCSPLOWO2_02_FULL_39_32]|nr:MAG: hypothetical protein A2034_06565 [Elusimicrobia bacterium GWA2_38_7]OGR79582.1 MAG: hypothetical protein A3B80_02810 [Elusimicrobia bacterium RIFCSPHIGHO2_02_FULL_39_36]OGR92908.1 MAG: hypothetical protein A3I11_04235 [Elusimicrobia bacterium RIFCSPLOWO2_02_FULL_39_32]OGR99692.1 MAG: hypothetical protein A3G85_01600 [Elusimicrobia bacterium RIFCSPLOWO2_12_FULL_39_28]
MFLPHKTKRSSNFWKNSLVLILGLGVAFITLELFLRIYNPFDFRIRIKQGKITLPINEKIEIKNNKNKKLDKLIKHSRNSLGFRGDNPPQNFTDYLTIMTIGGSTTECFYLSDEKTWPFLLGKEMEKKFNKCWINNAGLDGHSTSGHIVLMEDSIIKIKPKMILLLIGINDVNLSFFDKNKEVSESFVYRSVKKIIKPMINYSETLTLCFNIFRYNQALLNYKITDKALMSESKIVNQLQIDKYLNRDRFLQAYKIRLKKIVDLAKRNEILPILITQPMYCGWKSKNPDIEFEKILSLGFFNQKELWKKLELYNDITREIGKKENLLVIDIAHELESNPNYYYDLMHHTNEGAKKVAQIIYKKLVPFVLKKYPEFRKNSKTEPIL